MNKDNKEDLIKKYEAGESSLAEEQLLFDDLKDSNHTLSSWSKFVDKNKEKSPADMNMAIWEAIQVQDQKKVKHFRAWIASAAVILLLIGAFVFNKQKSNSYFEKEAKLNEALSLFDQGEEAGKAHSILYEDELVIIYTASE